VPDVVLDLPGGDVAELVALLDDTVVFANLAPRVDPDDLEPPSAVSRLLGARGPAVPLATWTPGEIGLQHGTGPRAVRTLAERGVPVPDEWYKVADHPRRGLVLRTYRSPPEETLRWLVRAATALCEVPIAGSWRAVVRTR
jgi:hypothetical protein